MVPDVVPRMATMTDDLVRECIAFCKAMGGVGCGEVVRPRTSGGLGGAGVLVGPTHKKGIA